MRKQKVMDEQIVNNQYNESVRAAILSASRILFAKFGYKKTTMEDIAGELHKGKSSLYYYFRNKEEIFQAVINNEENILKSELKKVLNSDLNPQERLREYVYVRMKTIRGLDNYYNALMNERFGGFNFVKSLKEKNEKVEMEMIKRILTAGVNEGVFQIQDLQMGAAAITLSLQGLEIPMFQSSEKYEDLMARVDDVMSILFYGLVKR